MDSWCCGSKYIRQRRERGKLHRVADGLKGNLKEEIRGLKLFMSSPPLSLGSHALILNFDMAFFSVSVTK